MVLRSCSQFFKFTLMGVGAIFQIVFRYMIACQYNLKLILCYSKKINYTLFLEGKINYTWWLLYCGLNSKESPIFVPNTRNKW